MTGERGAAPMMADEPLPPWDRRRRASPARARLIGGVFAGWLFCLLADPGAVIARIVPGLRSSGRFALQDYLNYRETTLEPRAPGCSLVAPCQAGA